MNQNQLLETRLSQRGAYVVNPPAHEDDDDDDLIYEWKTLSPRLISINSVTLQNASNKDPWPNVEIHTRNTITPIYMHSFDSFLLLFVFITY